MVVTGFRDTTPRSAGQRTEHLPSPRREFGGRGGSTEHGAAKTPRGTSHLGQGLHPPSFVGTKPGVPATLPRPRPLHPVPRAGPPALSGRRRAAAAGLGPLAGYCRRIYCIAACAGCSPAHNRLAVAQGSTLRGKEGGIHSDADCRAFAAVYCRIRPLAQDPLHHPVPALAEGLRGAHVSPPRPRAVAPAKFYGMDVCYGRGCPCRLGDTLLVPHPHPGGVWRGCSPRRCPGAAGDAGAPLAGCDGTKLVQGESRGLQAALIDRD